MSTITEILREEIANLQESLRIARQEADYWKGIADSLEFDSGKPDHSIPPRADGAN